MKKFDVDRLTGTRFLDITSENFRPIFLPIFISIVIFVGGVVLFLLTQNRIVFKVLFGLTGVAMAISGLGQIRLRMVPGFPSLRGGCAVIFGLAFFFMFFILGIIVIFFD